MKTIILKCTHCNEKFNKSLKEHRRRVKEGHEKFFCSRACSCKHNLFPNRKPWTKERKEKNFEHLKRIVALAAETNRKYSKEDLLFQDYIRKTIKRKKLENDLTIEYLKEIWNIQNGKCAISGIPLRHSLETNNNNYKASLDRIDSNKGYITGNVQFLSCSLNYAKNNSSDDELRELLTLIKVYSQ